MKTSDFAYALPPDLIAQEPLQDRSASRMMVVHRATGIWQHRHVSDLTSLLAPGDVLVVNDTRVIPARIFGKRLPTGGKVELLLLEERSPGVWESLFKASRRAEPGDEVSLASDRIRGVVLERGTAGRVGIRLSSDLPLAEVLESEGFAPLPPYIRRPAVQSARSDADRARYQTVYARQPGAVAAPTAGLHFTDELLRALELGGVRRAAVTLHVGLGTFKPVKTEELEEHVMEAERFEVGRATAESVAAAKREGRRVVAVGSTSVRTLEHVAAEHGGVVESSGRTALFIHPPYRFRVVDAMLTNFHLPASTLVMMVAAFAGHDLILRAYEEAVRERYRFYSYGDCMLIL